MRTKTLTRIAMYAGTFVVVGVVGKVHAQRHGYDLTDSSRFAWAAAFALLLNVSAYGSGLPDVLRSGWSVISRAASALASGAILVSVLQLFLGDALLPRFVVFGSVALLLPWYSACSAIASRGRARAGSRDRVLVVGESDDVELLRSDLVIEPERPAVLVGSLRPGDARSRGPAVNPLEDAARELRASVIVLSRRATDDDSIVHQAGRLHESGIRIRTMSLFYEQWLGKLPAYELERVSLFFDISEVHRSQYSRASRLLDLILAALGAVVLLPVTLLVLLVNPFANRGPLFYRQRRVGKNGGEFNIVKFRTMTPGVQTLHNEWTTEDDPRITPFGRVLRRSHLDELPQVLNIAGGDLSVVGPRPEQPVYVAELVAKLPFYELRHLVRPGLTGWAQVKYGYAGSESDALEKLQYEFFYLRHQSLRFDLRIIARTLRSVLGRRGR